MCTHWAQTNPFSIQCLLKLSQFKIPDSDKFFILPWADKFSKDLVSCPSFLFVLSRVFTPFSEISCKLVTVEILSARKKSIYFLLSMPRLHGASIVIACFINQMYYWYCIFHEQETTHRKQIHELHPQHCAVKLSLGDFITTGSNFCIDYCKTEILHILIKLWPWQASLTLEMVTPLSLTQGIGSFSSSSSLPNFFASFSLSGRSHAKVFLFWKSQLRKLVYQIQRKQLQGSHYICMLFCIVGEIQTLCP